MILVDIEVPIMEKVYDVQIDEQVLLMLIIEELSEMISQKEQCFLNGDLEELTLWNMDSRKRLSLKQTAEVSDIITGSRLLLV